MHNHNFRLSAFLTDSGRGPKRLFLDFRRLARVEWAESTVADFNSDSEMGRTIRLRGPNRLGRTIRRRGPNPSWAEPSGTRRFVVFNIFSTLSYVIVKSVSSSVLSSVLSNVGIFSRPFLGEDTREVGIPYLRQPQAQL